MAASARLPERKQGALRSLVPGRSPRSLFLLAFLLIGLLGFAFRFAFVWEVGHDPHLNVYLAKTDLYNYDLMAKDRLQTDPLGLRMVGYPLFIEYLAVFYRLFGPGPLPFYLHQLVLSALGVLLLTLTGRMIFGVRAGVFAGTLFLFYKMNYLYDAVKLHTALSQFAIIATLYFFCANRNRRSLWAYSGFMMSGIFLSLFRVFFWLILVPAAATTVIRERQWRRKDYAVLNVMFCLAAVAGFHHFHSSDAYRHKFGVHFFLGNHADSSGLLTPVRGIRTHAQGFAQDTILRAFQETGTTDGIDSFWIRKTFASYGGNPFALWKVFARKLGYLSNNYEPHDNVSVYFYEERTRLKGYPRLDYAFLFVPALLGALVAIQRKHPGRHLLLPTLFVCMMILTVFFCSRYRMPLIPFLCLLAGYGISVVIEALQSRNYRALALVLLVTPALFAWSYRDIPAFQKERDIAFWNRQERAKISIQAKREEALRRYRSWQDLQGPDKVQWAKRLGEVGLIHEFFQVFDDAYSIARRLGDEQGAVYLLSEKAVLLEEAFHFREASRIWQKLEAYSSIREKAQEKLEAIRIVGPVLDPEFGSP